MKIISRELLKLIKDFKKNNIRIVLIILLSLTLILLNVYSPILVKNIIDLEIIKKNIYNLYLYIFICIDLELFIIVTLAQVILIGLSN